MKIREYMVRIRAKSQEIFDQTIMNDSKFGTANHFSCCITELAAQISDINDKNMLTKVSSQLEYSYINLAFGMYRQAFSSLRLALELGLSAAFFSVNKLEQYEWMHGRTDIVWAKLIDRENGVLSKRYALAFFPELDKFVDKYNMDASAAYRKLSEYVHGNNETWGSDGIWLQYKQDLVDMYFIDFNNVAKIILFVLSCRYLKSFTDLQTDSLQFLFDEMNHIPPIREILGGAKE